VKLEENMHMNDVRMRAIESFFGPKLWLMQS
jgi:hypothetical protein